MAVHRELAVVERHGDVGQALTASGKRFECECECRSEM